MPTENLYHTFEAAHERHVERQSVGRKPRIFDAFPAVYYHEDGRHKKVHTEEEAKAATEAGWQDKPFPPKAVVNAADENAKLTARVEKLEATVDSLVQRALNGGKKAKAEDPAS